MNFKILQTQDKSNNYNVVSMTAKRHSKIYGDISIRIKTTYMIIL